MLRENFMSVGTTSACAENTCVKLLTCINRWNYLRVRGEYDRVECGIDLDEELPPRARRIREHAAAGECQMGTTSACAENTLPNQPCYHRKWNYLRVRGEYR